MTNEEVKALVETKTYRQAREHILKMDPYELQMLYYWGFHMDKNIFCSAAAGLLHEHYGMIPNYDLCGGSMSEYT